MNLQLMSLRKAAGYKSRKALADALGDGYSERQIKSWEDGDRMLSLEQASDIASLLHCTLDELAGRKWPRPSYSDPRQQAINHCYGLLDERSKSDLSGIASTFTADPSRLASSTGDGAQDVGVSA